MARFTIIIGLLLGALIIGEVSYRYNIERPKALYLGLSFSILYNYKL